MKKVFYYVTVLLMIIFGFPIMIFCRDKWNSFGRKVDKYFGVESQHTKNYKSGKYNS